MRCSKATTKKCKTNTDLDSLREAMRMAITGDFHLVYCRLPAVRPLTGSREHSRLPA